MKIIIKKSRSVWGELLSGVLQGSVIFFYNDLNEGVWGGHWSSLQMTQKMEGMANTLEGREIFQQDLDWLRQLNGILHEV